MQNTARFLILRYDQCCTFLSAIYWLFINHLHAQRKSAALTSGLIKQDRIPSKSNARDCILRCALSHSRIEKQRRKSLTVLNISQKIGYFSHCQMQSCQEIQCTQYLFASCHQENETFIKSKLNCFVFWNICWIYIGSVCNILVYPSFRNIKYLLQF